ncbi:c-type cytochrome [Phycobacter azelaicus]|uniref:c-type cytochrome n=1 Tax=Phycobacter azelaicus TaxID=2668075 RepID=UPI00186744B5|nr:c-type cytochrome [Phycobacter azelaicus]
MRLLASLSLVASVCAGSIPAQEFTTLKGHGGPIMGLDAAPSGQVASASFDNSAALWAGRLPQWLEGHDAAVTAVSFAGAGRLVTGGDDFALRLWMPDGTSQVLGLHKGKVRGLAVSPDGQMLASASWDGSVGIWSLETGSLQRMIDLGSGVNDVAYGGESMVFAATMDGRILGIDPAGKSAPRPMVEQGFSVNRLVVDAEAGWLAYGAVDGATRVIDLETAAEVADFTLDRRPVLAMDYHAATGQLAVGDGHGYIMMIATGNTGERWRIARDFRAARKGPIWALAFSPDGDIVWAGGLDDVIYGWPVALMGTFDPAMGQEHSFLRPADSMPNGERQFMRKCSICHALTEGESRKAGPTLYALFGRRAGSLPGYRYSPVLDGSDIIWNDETIDALFDLGPDHYIPGSKMPMQRITAAEDRRDLVAFLKHATQPEK